MKQFDQDPVQMMTRVLDPETPVTVIDIGANVGDTVARFVLEFPSATVYALEPVSDVFATLSERAMKMPGVKAFKLAVGETSGEVTFNITRNRWCSSLLKPSERGKAYYGDWYDVVRTETVPLVTLDQFVREQGIASVDVLKIDVQGLEMPVLRGAKGLLSSGTVKIVQCEAQLVQEYEGASTFAEIDLFFRNCGYTIHQIHDLEVKGDELQTSYLDAVWLRNDVLAELRRSPKKMYEPRCVARMRDALSRCASRGDARVAIYGAGHHTKKTAMVLSEPPPGVKILGVIDDDPSRHGQTVAGLKVISQAEAKTLGVKAVVLSSDSFEDALWEKSATMRASGVRVERLYGEATTLAS